MTTDDLARQKNHFWSRTAYYASLGYDRLAAVAFILETAGPLDGPVLDVSTGMGMTARGLAGRELEVISIHPNAEDQAVAATLTEEPAQRSRIRFMATSAASLPFPDGHFGAAVAVDVLHHLEAGLPALAELARLVKPGGAVVFADFPCRSVGQVELETFARTVDPRIVTTCVHCPPDPKAEGHCGWEFRITAGETYD